MRYDLTDLRLFVAVAEDANLTRGAARCHLAPSSASHRLKALEEALGAPLLERLPRGVRLTRAGEVLLQGARQVFAQLEQMHADLAPYAQGIRAQVVVHANTNATNSFLPDDLGGYLHAHPQVRVSLKESTSPEVLRAVAAGEAEVGVVAGSVDGSGLESRPYRRDRLVLAVPPGHPIAARGQVKFAEVATEPFVLLHAGSAIHTFMMGMAADLGVTLDARIQVNSFEAILRMVGAGVGFGMVPASAIARHPNPRSFAVVSLDEAWADRNLRICVRRFADLSAHARALVEHLIGAPPGPAAAAAPSARGASRGW
jgi:DNA-binding transcriptional LysR family regulator